MRTWIVPAWNGDFRLTAGDDDKTSKLLVMAPTPHEIQLLNGFLSKAQSLADHVAIDTKAKVEAKNPSLCVVN